MKNLWFLYLAKGKHSVTESLFYRSLADSSYTTRTHINPGTHNALWIPAAGRSCLGQSHCRSRTHSGRAPHSTSLLEGLSGRDCHPPARCTPNSSTKIVPKLHASAPCTSEGRVEDKKGDRKRRNFCWTFLFTLQIHSSTYTKKWCMWNYGKIYHCSS